MSGSGKSTGLVSEWYEGNGVFGIREGSVNLPMSSGASGYNLDDRRGLPELLRDCVLLEEPREIITAITQKLKDESIGG